MTFYTPSEDIYALDFTKQSNVMNGLDGSIVASEFIEVARKKRTLTQSWYSDEKPCSMSPLNLIHMKDELSRSGFGYGCENLSMMSEIEQERFPF